VTAQNRKLSEVESSAKQDGPRGLRHPLHTRAHALIIDDDVNSREALAHLVAAEGFTVTCTGSLREARIQLTRRMPDVILVDLYLPDGVGLELVADIEQENPPKIILVTGRASVETAVDALRKGVSDYLTKPVNLDRLRIVLSHARPSEAVISARSLRDEVAAAEQSGRFGHLLGRAPEMLALYRRLARVAPSEATVFLVGESGTGKELVAQTLHDFSARAGQPFLAVNCGAIAPQLIESEMFGHERGSFTGAERQHRGYFERARGGTLFLDEVTEMPLELQVKLLRVLESRRFMRVGTDREITADVRVIAASNRDPEAAVASGHLRSDLFHRLNVFPLQLPPLRTRHGDVRLLAEHFLAGLNAPSKSRKTFAPSMLAALEAHTWPGNVRELKNVVQREFLLAKDELIGGEPFDAGADSASASEAYVEIPIGTSLAEADRRLILATLRQCSGVRKISAELLGISLKTLYNRLEEYRRHTPDEPFAEPAPPQGN